jgi:hypothetical protein
MADVVIEHLKNQNKQLQAQFCASIRGFHRDGISSGSFFWWVAQRFKPRGLLTSFGGIRLQLPSL